MEEAKTGASSPAITPQTRTPAEAEETRRAWIRRVTAGPRGSDGLTTDERDVLLRLRSASFELQSAWGFRHYSRWAAA